MTEQLPRPEWRERLARAGAALGLGGIGTLDLLALEDLTTAGMGLAELGFLVASVPALIVLARRLRQDRRAEEQRP